jgi:hypothetical protein
MGALWIPNCGSFVGRTAVGATGSEARPDPGHPGFAEPPPLMSETFKTPRWPMLILKA